MEWRGSDDCSSSSGNGGSRGEGEKRLFVGKLFYLPSIKPNLLSEESDLLLLLLDSLPSFRGLFL